MADSAAEDVVWEVTGNHTLAFPFVSPEDGGIARANVLSRNANGLVEWAPPEGGALLAPRFRVRGADLRPGPLVWDHLEHWIPRFRATLPGGIGVQGTLCAPAGFDLSLRGAVYLFEVSNRGDAEQEIEVALEGAWSWSLRTLLSSRPLRTRNRIVRQGNALVLEAGDAAALALLPGPGDGGGVAAALAGRELEDGEEASASNGDPIRLRAWRRIRLAPGRRATVSFFLAVAPERDGALATASYLRTVGGSELVRRGRLELARLTRKLDAGDLAALFNRNLLFNYFFAVGRAVDDDRFYAVCSRSPVAPGAGVFREREALLWSLPALTLADPALARELLLSSLEQHSHRAGEDVHYLDGGVLAPGLGVSALCAYGVALDRYIHEAADDSLRDEPLVQDVLRELDVLLYSRLHPEVFLAASDVLPSGEAADHPYVTFDNAMLWAFCGALDRVWVPEEGEDRPQLSGGVEEVAAAIWQNCVTGVAGLDVLAWSVDLEGEAALYDDPGGSLALLPSLGFCEPDDPIWRNTMDFLRSPRYPLHLGGAAFPGEASRRHPGAASLAAVCAELLGPRRDEALALLRRLPLEGGLACATYDPATGSPAGGRQFGALAGFLAWALWSATEGR